MQGKPHPQRAFIPPSSGEALESWMSPMKLNLLHIREDAQTEMRGPAKMATNRDLIDDFGSTPAP